MDHKDKVVHLFWFTLGRTMSQKVLTVSNTLKRGLMMGLYSHVFPTSTATHIPSGISTEMLSTPLLTVRGLVCSEGEDAHSSCNPIG